MPARRLGASHGAHPTRGPLDAGDLRQAVLISLPGDSSQCVLVPAFEPTPAGAQADAVALLQSFLKVPAQRWLTQIYQTHHITTLDIKE